MKATMLILINLFKKPSAHTLAQKELEENQRNLLAHESATAYNHKMTEYYRMNVQRLSKYIQEQ